MWQGHKNFFAVASCIILYFPLQSHSNFIPAIDACLMINKCEHTGIEVCAKDTQTLKSRSFRDECDMIEHNCYNQNDFVITNVTNNNCRDFNKNKTENLNNTDTTTIKKDVTSKNIQNSTTSDYISSKLTPRTVTENVKNISQVTQTTTDSPNTEAMITTDYSTTGGFATTMDNRKIMIPTNTLPFFNVYVHIDSVNIETKSKGLTTLRTTSFAPLTEFITASTTSTPLTTTAEPKTLNSKADPSITITKTSSTTNANITTKIFSTVHPNVTSGISSTINNENTSREIEPKTTSVSNENTTTNFENSTTVSPIYNVTCKEYPKDCNIPSTWETTKRGESRDFLKILRDRFGKNLKIMYDTTHFPKRRFKISEDNELDSFVLGNHNES